MQWKVLLWSCCNAMESWSLAAESRGVWRVSTRIYIYIYTCCILYRLHVNMCTSVYVNVYVYAYIYVPMSMSMSIYIYIYIYHTNTWIYIYIYTYVCMYVCMYVRTNVRMYVCMYVCIEYICTCLYLSISIYIYIYTYLHNTYTRKKQFRAWLDGQMLRQFPPGDFFIEIWVFRLISIVTCGFVHAWNTAVLGTLPIRGENALKMGILR